MTIYIVTKSPGGKIPSGWGVKTLGMFLSSETAIAWARAQGDDAVNVIEATIKDWDERVIPKADWPTYGDYEEVQA